MPFRQAPFRTSQVGENLHSFHKGFLQGDTVTMRALCQTDKDVLITRLKNINISGSFVKVTFSHVFRLRRADTRKPRNASVLSTHSDTQAVPAFHCIRMFKGISSTRAFKKRTDTLSTIASKRSKNYFDTLVLLKRAFRHARVLFLNARFRPSN